jgi:hypothetical protein
LSPQDNKQAKRESARREAMKKSTLVLLTLCSFFWLPPAFAQLDPDGDGILLTNDNCPNNFNPNQEDADYDGRGDACDNCFLTYNPNQANADGDAQGNVCDATPGTNDRDGDGFIDSEDNCPLLTNDNQNDVDEDSIGDVCDSDFGFAYVAKHNNSAERRPLVPGVIVPQNFFGPGGELLVGITGIHQLVRNAVTNSLGSLPEDRSPVDFRFSVTGGATVPVAEWQNNPPFGVTLVYNTSDYPIVVPQQSRGATQAGDAVIQLGLNLEMTTDGGATYRTVDYTTVSVIDGRDIEQEANQPVSDRPMSLQLTTPGIEKLGETLASSQPYPDMASFNQALQSDVSKFDDEKTLTASAPICVPLNSIPEFKQLPAWPKVRDEARALYTTYQSLEATVCSDENQGLACGGTAVALVTGTVLLGPAGAAAAALASAQPAAQCAACQAMERWCTKEEWPEADDFEVCFDGFSGSLVSQNVSELSAMRLSVPDDRDNELDLDVSFSDIDTRVDIRLSNFSIRYAEGANNCLFRPEQDVPQSEIDNNFELARELSCPNAQVFADSACTSCKPDFPAFPDRQSFPEPFGLAISQADKEKFVATDLGDASIMLKGLQANLPGNTVCTDPGAPSAVADNAQDLLETFYQESFNLLNYTWERDWSTKSRAENITDLFSPLHTGLPESDYARDDLQFIDLSLNSVDGLIAEQSVNVESGPLSIMPPAAMLYKGYELGGAIYTGGTSPVGDFDVQQTLNLAYLNRRIAAQYRDTMAISLNPSWEDLGLTPPAGVAPTLPVPMTADVLGQWNPVFLPLNGLPVAFNVQVPVLPFTWMEPDYITPDAPIFFEAPRVVVTVTDEKGGLLGKIVGHYEATVNFNLSGDDFNNNADGFTIGDWQFGVIDSLNFPDCNFKDALQSDPCAASFSNSMEALFEPVFDAAFREFFGVLQSPALFTQRGDALIPALSDPLSPKDSLASNGHSSRFGTFSYSLGPDSDDDGVPDTRDNCIETPNTNQQDRDDDGLGDICDDDDDGDGFVDNIDLCPLVASTQLDTDADKFGDECDSDLDGDGVLNVTDNCVAIVNPDQKDADQDGEGNVCDVDIDNDGVSDADDNCPTIRNREQQDTDDDGVGDRCDIDADSDGINNNADNCPDLFNPDQLNRDLDRLGDACDSDFDNDGVFNDEDNCVYVWNPLQQDGDNDGIGDSCADPLTVDSDGDGIPDVDDAFPYSPAASEDSDGDGNPDQISPFCNPPCLRAMGLTEDTDDDNDGYSDEEELDYGTDTLDPGDAPAPPGLSTTTILSAFCQRRPNHRACR